MAGLAASKVYLTILLFEELSNVEETSEEWVVEVFRNNTELFPTIERIFECCGTTGHSSYNETTLPPSCCGSDAEECLAEDALDGCVQQVAIYFHMWGYFMAVALLILIPAELASVVVCLFLSSCTGCEVELDLEITGNGEDTPRIPTGVDASSTSSKEKQNSEVNSPEEKSDAEDMSGEEFDSTESKEENELESSGELFELMKIVR